MQLFPPHLNQLINNELKRIAEQFDIKESDNNLIIK